MYSTAYKYTSPFRLAIICASLLALALISLQTTPALAEVAITGLNKEQEKNVRALMSLSSADCSAGKWRIERLYKDADRQLIAALQALGFYDVTFSKSLSWQKDCWQAEFKVNPGNAVRLRVVDIRIDGPAQENQQFLNKIKNNGLKVDEPLHHGRYRSYRDKLLRTANAFGYLDARYTRNEVIVDTDSGSADVALLLASGPRYRFGEITYTPGILDSRLLTNFTDIKEGSPYHSQALSDLSAALTNSGYFGTVRVRALPQDSKNHTVPIKIELSPGKSRQYNTGIGFSTDTGAQGRISYINKRRSDQGDQIENKLFVSELSSEISTSYRWPHQNRRSEWFNIHAGILQEQTDYTESLIYKLGLSRSTQLSPRWLIKPYIDFNYEEFNFGSGDDSSLLILPGISWESIIGRKLGRIQNGRLLSYDLRGTTTYIGSDTDFLQLRIVGKWLHSFNDKTRILLRGNLGASLKNDLDELPVSFRFFTGGDNKLRGYKYQSLGPTNRSGQLIGGSHLLELSIEFDHMIYGNWAAATFLDIGSAFNNNGASWNRGIGAGIRWHSPVGPIRIDLAHPLDHPSRNWRIHISMGPDL